MMEENKKIEKDDEQNLKNIRVVKGKKIKNKIMILCGIILTVFLGVYFVKNYYLEKFLKDSLGVEFSNVYRVPLTKTLVLKDVVYRDLSKEGEEKYQIETLEISLESYDLKNKIINLGTITADNLKIVDSNGKDLLSPEQQQEPQKLLSEELLKNPQEKPVEQNIKTEEKKEKKKKSSNSLSGFLNALQSTFVETTIDVTNLIDEEWLQQQVDKALADALKKHIKEYSIHGKKLLERAEKKLEEEKLNHNFWTINIKKVDVISQVFGQKFQGSFENLTNRLSTMDKPVVFMVNNLEGASFFGGEIFIPTVSGETNLEIKDFNYSKIPQVKNYILDGNIEILEKSNYTVGDFEKNGVINLTDLTLNNSYIIDQISKSQGISKKDKRLKALNYALKKVKEIKIEYTYNSLTDKLYLKTNLVKEIKRIISENTVDVIKEIT